MKKYIPILLSILLLALPCFAAEASYAERYFLADFDSDGEITALDAIHTTRALLEGEYALLADLNGDGRSTLMDILLVLRFATANAPITKLDGKGTASDPYQIASADDLATLADHVLSGTNTKNLYCKQTCDIDLSVFSNWTAIGTGGIPFAGHYDGGGYTVRGLHIESSESFQGLFGFVTGTVENLTVYGDLAVHYEEVYSHSFVGGIAGAMNNGAVIRNCNSYVTVTGDAYVGGVVGAMVYTDSYLSDAIALIEGCNFYGTLTANDSAAINEDAMYFGGISGRTYGAMRGCTNYGDVLVSGEKTKYVGGITGYFYSPYKDEALPKDKLPFLTVENCINYGAVCGGVNVAGIAGQSSLPMQNCVNHGNISGNQHVGGIVGINGTSATYAEGYTVLSNCTNNGKISVTDMYGGGIAGYNYAIIQSVENTAEVCGSKTAQRVGGIAGYSRGNVSNATNAASATVYGNQGVGGIVGYFNQANATVSECTNLASVQSHSEADNAYHIGGIVGMLGSTNSVLHCINKGDVHGGGGESATGGTGGIVGSMHSGSVVDGCENRGNVSGKSRVGGIAGYGKMSTASHVRSCDNYGAVSSSLTSGKARLGGIVGSATSGNITNCTNRGAISVAEEAIYFSATVGYLSDTTVVTNVNSEV